MSSQQRITTTAKGIAAMFGSLWLINVLFFRRWNTSQDLKTMLGVILLYTLGLGLFLWMTRKLPRVIPQVKPVKLSLLLTCFLLQFTAILAMSLLNMIKLLLLQTVNTPAMAFTPVTILLLLIVNPVAEEFVFRKLLAERLLPLGEWVYVLTSSFCFALVHVVGRGPLHVVYTFMLGLIWSYLYVKSGNLWYPILLHALSNLFAGVLSRFMETLGLLVPYSLFMMFLGLAGLILLLRRRGEIHLERQADFTLTQEIKRMLSSRGIQALILVVLVFVFVKYMLQPA